MYFLFSTPDLEGLPDAKPRAMALPTEHVCYEIIFTRRQLLQVTVPNKSKYFLHSSFYFPYQYRPSQRYLLMTAPLRLRYPKLQHTNTNRFYRLLIPAMSQYSLSWVASHISLVIQTCFGQPGRMALYIVGVHNIATLNWQIHARYPFLDTPGSANNVHKCTPKVNISFVESLLLNPASLYCASNL